MPGGKCSGLTSPPKRSSQNVSNSNMKRLSQYIILTFLTLFLIACGHSNKNIKTRNQESRQTGELIKINFSDTNYLDLPLYAKDTVTKDGWAIKYFIKGDSSKYNDIWIQCKKGNLTGTYQGKDLLQFRRYFIPVFAGETNSFIYFTHGCATDCSALLVFSKDNPNQFMDYESVVDYSIKFNQVLYLTDSCYKNEDKIYDLALVDLNNNKTHKITYNNICGAVNKPSCIDTVIFSKSQVTIKTTLRKSIETEQEIRQTKIIKL